MRQDLKVSAAEHLGQIELGLRIDCQGMRVDAGLMGFPNGLPDIRDAVATLIAVVVGWLAITDQDQKLFRRPFML
jgi:hypothetical protein